MGAREVGRIKRLGWVRWHPPQASAACGGQTVVDPLSNPATLYRIPPLAARGHPRADLVGELLDTGYVHGCLGASCDFDCDSDLRFRSGSPGLTPTLRVSPPGGSHSRRPRLCAGSHAETILPGAGDAKGVFDQRLDGGEWASALAGQLLQLGDDL